MIKLNDKFFLRLIWVVTAVVLVVVAGLKLAPAPENKPPFIYLLPHLIGAINATCAILLVVSLMFIRRKKIQAHKTTNIVTFILSSVFLIFYILFHLYEKDTRYGDVDHNGVLNATELAAVSGTRMIYFFILSTHIVLAIIVLPLILVSFLRGFSMQVERHRKIVKWAFPVWLYVAVSGVVVYLMISPYYNF